jgi:hypothetical protein
MPAAAACSLPRGSRRRREDLRRTALPTAIEGKLAEREQTLIWPTVRNVRTSCAGRKALEASDARVFIERGHGPVTTRIATMLLTDLSERLASCPL